MADADDEQGKAANMGHSPTSKDHPWLRTVWIAILLIGGILLVACSSSLGVTSVENCSAPGTCSWSNEQADAAAVIWRFVGVMAFVAGLVERVLIALVKPRNSEK